MYMVNQVVAWFVALTDRLGSHIIHASNHPGHEFRSFLGVMTIFVVIYGTIFAIAWQEEKKRVGK